MRTTNDTRDDQRHALARRRLNPYIEGWRAAEAWIARSAEQATDASLNPSRRRAKATS